MAIPNGPLLPEFDIPNGYDLQNSFARSLIPVVDAVRNVAVNFGVFPYLVRLVTTRWTTANRGVGVEQVVSDIILTPIPRVTSLDGLADVANPVGLDELGSCRVTGISGRYSEGFLRGLDQNYNSPAQNTNFAWEISFPNLGSLADYGLRRRFTLAAAPNYEADNAQWTVILQRSRGDRQNNGQPALP